MEPGDRMMAMEETWRLGTGRPLHLGTAFLCWCLRQMQQAERQCRISPAKPHACSSCWLRFRQLPGRLRCPCCPGLPACKSAWSSERSKFRDERPVGHRGPDQHLFGSALTVCGRAARWREAPWLNNGISLKSWWACSPSWHQRGYPYFPVARARATVIFTARH